jgi:serine/threonine protein kinase
MQLVEGQNFLNFVRTAEKACDIERLKGVLRQLVAGVQALHHSNYIHRDLKPGNVLVRSNGSVVILDFGLIRHLSLEDSGQVVSFVGTPAYMSPEQCRRRPLSASSDWYSVGVMLFQALTGELPGTSRFANTSEMSTAEERIEARTIDPESPVAIERTVSPNVGPVSRKASYRRSNLESVG